ncbi:hypothetical protein BH20ACI4_BH20ACI4_01150 [soil metagenome]
MSKRKLLLADDSETVQKVVNLTFELEGIEVITFGDGDSAMEQFSAIAPDVVLADVNMPGMSGYDICQNIKSDESTKNTPVILLVGSFEPFDEEKAMQVGADDYLTKPFQSIRQLVSKVNELLSLDTDNSQVNSFDETLRMEENPYSESDFGDPGMDDEIIQTNQVVSSTVDETAKYQTQPDFQDDEEADVSKTQPLNAKDWQDIYSAEQSPEDSAETVYELADEQAGQPETEKTPELTSDEVDFDESNERISVETDFESKDEYIYVDSAPETIAEQESDGQNSVAALEEDSGLQPDDIDHFYKEPGYEEEEENVETQNFAADPEQPEFSDEEQNSETDQTGESEKYVSIQTDENFSTDSDISIHETIEMKTASVEDSEAMTERSQMSSPVPVLNFDELDFLEISMPETIKTYRAAETSKAEPPPAEFSAQEESVTTENETEQVKIEVTEQLSGVNLSAADIDAIAEKVVEKLSARLKE